MLTPVTSTDEPHAPAMPPDAMAIVAAERLRQHEKIVRLRALREAAQAERSPVKEKTRHGRVQIPV